MGFSSALQGRAAHEALVVRQDAELRLMDTMKRSMQMKAKCDREYAISLAAVAQQGLKIDRADELQGSLITKSWRSYMDELDLQAKQFKINAELLEVVCEKLSHLSQDKRKARKTYQEEHAKIAARLNHLTDEVVRKKAEYQKHLEGYKALRTRFEEHYIKSGRGGRKLDDVRDKYQKACRKLHLTHNEYVLSITEAIEVEKDFRSVLLPGLLEHQQSVQESFILLWKNILQEASQHGDLTSDKFKEIQKRIDNVINNINPSEEYREFTEKHKTSPTTPLIFQFDESLIEDIPGKLQSNTLTVDNLTVDWLRSRLIDLELAVKECQEKQFKMIEHVNGGSPIANGNQLSNGNGHTNSIQSNKDHQSRQSKDLSALRCQEKQKQKLVDMIKCALNEVGCEELPSGCDDHLAMDQNFIENGFNNDQQTSNTSSASVSIINELKRRGGVLTLWRGRHFKRKSTPQPTTPTAARLHTQRLEHLKPRSQSLGSLSVNSSPARYEPIITNYPLRMAASVEATTCTNRRRELNAIDLMETMRAFSSAANDGGGGLALRRTHCSMLCVAEESRDNKIADNAKPAVVAAAAAATATNYSPSIANTPNNNNNNKNNNNNIYTDLVLEDRGDGESIKSGELAVKQMRNVEIEINWKQDQEQGCIPENPIKTETASENLTAITTTTTPAQPNQQPPTPPPSPPPLLPLPMPNSYFSKLLHEKEPTKNSIDIHLDKIDELNRALDCRLKRNITQQTNLDLDVIESVDSVVVVTRSKTHMTCDDKSSSKRTSSSSSDCHAYLSRKGHDPELPATGKNTKKRSMSFSQKSINAFISNIKVFSKSPLARMSKHHVPPVTTTGYTQTLQEDDEKPKNEDFSSTESNQNSEDITNNSKTSDTVTTSHSNSNSKKSVKDISKSEKLKFKMPKIQKKSKGIRQTFRTKLMNFQMKRNNNQKLCKTCTKRRRIHPSKSVFDFAKEFNLPPTTEAPISLPPTNSADCDGSDDECVEFCTCPRDTESTRRRLSVANTEYQKRASSSSMDAEDECDDDSSDDMLGGNKEPCYCIPSLSTSVSKRSSAERLRYEGDRPK